MASRLKLTFTDGREPLEVALTAAAIVKAERRYGTSWIQDHRSEATLWIGYMQCGQGQDFDTWLDTVDSFEEVADPTNPSTSEQSSGSASTSASTL